MRTKKEKIFPLYQHLFVDRFDYFSDFEIKVFESDTMSRAIDEPPLFEFRLTPLLTINDFEKIARESGNYNLSIRLYQHISLFSFTILQQSVGWLNSVCKANGAFDVLELRKEYAERIITKYPCPLIKVITKRHSDNIDIYGVFRDALKYANQNNIDNIEDLLYQSKSKHKFVAKRNFGSVLKREYSAIGKAIIDTIINISYIKFDRYLVDFPNARKKPESLLSLFGSNRKRARVFIEYLRELGVNQSSSDVCLSALIRAALHYNIVPSEFSESRIFNLIAKYFNIQLKANAKPRHRGKRYDEKFNEAVKFIKTQRL